jgi:hypothetical protein
MSCKNPLSVMSLSFFNDGGRDQAEANAFS